jgi:restriction system protein
LPGPWASTDDEDAGLSEAAVLADSAAAEENAEFALESHLEEFLIGNWQSVDWGRPLQLWRGPDGQSGHQLSTPVGRLDFLCTDTAKDSLVVVELKRGRPSDRVVGQILRYIGYVQIHMAAPGQAVEGLIIGHDADDALRYAVSAIPTIRLMTYQVAFSLTATELPRATQSASLA